MRSTTSQSVGALTGQTLRFITIVVLCVCAASTGAVARDSNGDLAAQIDQIMTAAYKPDQPGAAVIVVKDGKTIFRKGYGMADLELGVKIEPDHVFRIGSITKQFTAVAILELMERGKLSLSDEITRFFPDFPTHGQKITIEHLLTHTSGIKSYTSLPEWLSQWRKDMTVKEIIDLFKDKPMDFAPGEKWSYSNSGYILLGAIIEKVSGMSYEDFLQKNIFDVVGMKSSYYGNAGRIIAHRIPGYSKGKTGLENAAYLSMTQPYAAGSLLSTVDDLALWDAALYTDKLVKQETLKRAFTPYKLNNGVVTGYGYGWTMVDYEGHLMIEHGGGINGFITYMLRVPQDHVFVSVLTNKDFGPTTPDDVAFKIACLAIGKPYKDPVAISLAEKALDAYVGVYAIDEKEQRVISREGNQLYSQRSGGEKQPIYPLSETEFFYKESDTRLTFSKGESGAIAQVTARGRYGPPEIAKKTSKALPSARKEIKLDPASLDQFTGEYEIAPGMAISVTKETDALMAQMPGQPKVQIFPESDTKFFLKVVDAQIEFVKDASGKINGAVLTQGSQTLNCKKTK
jgi:CubicO group peptidase (beta-lactamase class C family)